MPSEILPILLVEDNPEHVEFLRQLLATPELSHFHLETVGSLAEALDWLKTGSISLILLDLTLPDSDGLETFIRVFEAAPQTPLVVLSGINDVGLALETVQLGAQDYLVKGRVDNHLLQRAMQYAIERKRAHTAISVLGALQLIHVAPPWLAVAGVTIAAGEAVTVIVLRAHYTMDVFAALFAAWGADVIAQHLSPTLDRWLGHFG